MSPVWTRTLKTGSPRGTVLSPDGTAIAVNWWGGERGVLRLVRSDGTGLRTLVDAGGDAIPYQWSRDGSMILASLVDRPGVNTIALVGRRRRSRAAASTAGRVGERKPGADEPVAGRSVCCLRLPGGPDGDRPGHLHPRHAHGRAVAT